MGEAAAAGALDSGSDDRWVDDLLSGVEPGCTPAPQPRNPDDDGFGVDATALTGGESGGAAEPVSDPNLQPLTCTVDAAPVDLDADAADAAAASDAPGADAGAKRTAVVLGVGLVVAVTAIVAALVMFGDGSTPPERRADNAPRPAPVAAAQPVPTSPVPAVPQDQSIPFTASAPCAAGSTSAQSLTDTASDSAWVCARATRDEALEGKVLTVDFGKTYMVSGVEVTPGWVAKTPGGQGRWLQHRVVSRLQYVFFNGNVVSDIYTQDTGNVHGPVSAALPRRVLASRVNVVVLQTSRPPSSPLPPADSGVLPETQPGRMESLLGEGGAPLSPETQTAEPYPDLTVPDSGSDPVDNTFAMSSLKFLGYQP
ncbi:hypothetical protein [Mycobacterium lehmannii]|uniref:hypothetical protein n=1 Tax=Mycobacterium lehmannii TaxID=2048550 RepID=UPI001E360FB5|nr:hypothetical protein [Mycobacterium lehmannii]